jgi:ABC-type Fe3+-siderophore transport system permease subunit
MNMGIKVCLLLCCCTTLTVLGSPPNNEKMQPCTIRFQNLQVAKEYTFYWRADHGSFTYIFTKDSSFSIPADEQHPDGGYFWGINSITKKATNTIEFRNNFSPDRLILLKAIINDSIWYDEQQIANANVVAKKDRTADKPVIERTKTPKIFTALFVIAGFMALVIIILFIFRNKKRKAQGTGS